MNKLRSLWHYRKNALLIFVAVIGLCFGGSTARVLAAAPSPCPSGISPNDCAALFGPWVNWDPESSLGTCATGVGTTTLTGDSNVEKIFNYFISQGLGAIQAAGIMGNMSKESGFNPTAEQTAGAWENMGTGYGSAVGLVQWDGGRRPAVINYLNSQGLTDADFHTASDKLLIGELNYVMKELKGDYKDSTLTPMLAAKTAADAALIFHQGYEGSSDGPDKIQGRMDEATAIFNTYGGGAGGTTGTGTGGACPSSNSKYAIDGSGFVYYSQCDPQWGQVAFAGNNMCGAGCGPTSMAMIVSTLTGQTVTPDQAAALATQMGDILPNGDISWKIISDIATHYNLTATHIGIDVAKINATLAAGGLVITSGTGTVPFTSEGHFVVIRGVTSDGKWLLGDPDTAAGHSSTTPFDPQAVIAAGMTDGSTYAITK